MSTRNIPDDLVEVAYILGPYGVRGQVKVRTFSADSPLSSISQWWLARTGPDKRRGPLRDAQLQSCKAHSGDLIAALGCSPDRDVAETLKGYGVWVSRADFPAPDEDEFYWVDLEGCEVYAHQETGQALFFGVVTQVSDNTAHGILHIERRALSSDGEQHPLLDKKGRPRESLVPFVKAHVLEVDLPNQRLLIDWPLDD